MYRRLIATSLVLLFSGCSVFEREPGPAERIGRALDEMRKGFDELAPDETPEQRRIREDREWRRRQDEYYRSHPDARRNSYDSEYDRNSRDSVDLYGDRAKSKEEQDREFWSRPAPARDEDDHY